MDILDALRQTPSDQLFRLYLTIGRMLNDPRRILECKRKLHLGLTVQYIADDINQPWREGKVIELRPTQVVVHDARTHKNLLVPYAAISTDKLADIPQASAPPLPRLRREDFKVGDTVSFTDQHLQHHVGIVVRVNTKTASIQCGEDEGLWRVSFGALNKVINL